MQQTLITASGGLALFLLAMLMMTDGLKTFAGGGLRRMLAHWTSTPLRGVFAGIAVTALVQSSSAVTIATIGFVNAGMLTMRQALGVVYGTNVGTTMTGWLVSLVGAKWDIANLALPLLTVGVVLRLAAERRAWRGLGEALAGFGLFFLALSLLQQAFAGLAETQGAALAARGSSIPMAVAAGFLVTLLTQSSSAALALILSAAAGGLLDLQAAAAAVIGANVGTTSTAALATLGATPAARRLALGHIAFNVITGVIALLVLPLALAFVARLADALDDGVGVAPTLALFHTTFNVFGVLLMLPLTTVLATRLERLFVSRHENIAKPEHLDQTLGATPALAVAALESELRRLGGIVGGTARALPRSLGAAPSKADRADVERPAAAARELATSVVRFASQVQSEAMPSSVAADLARAVRTARYLDEAARLVPRVAELFALAAENADPAVQERVRTLHASADAAFAALEALAHGGDGAGQRDAAPGGEQAFEARYADTKAEVLKAIVQRRVGVDAADGLLDALSALRRLVDRCVKAAQMLRAAQAGAP